MDYSTQTVKELVKESAKRNHHRLNSTGKAELIKILVKDDAERKNEEEAYQEYLNRDLKPVAVPNFAKACEEYLPDFLTQEPTEVPKGLTAEQLYLLRSPETLEMFYAEYPWSNPNTDRERYLYIFKTKDGKYVRLELDATNFVKENYHPQREFFYDYESVPCRAFEGSYREYQTEEDIVREMIFVRFCGRDERDIQADYTDIAWHTYLAWQYRFGKKDEEEVESYVS